MTSEEPSVCGFDDRLNEPKYPKFKNPRSYMELRVKRSLAGWMKSRTERRALALSVVSDGSDDQEGSTPAFARFRAVGESACERSHDGGHHGAGPEHCPNDRLEAWVVASEQVSNVPGHHDGQDRHPLSGERTPQGRQGGVAPRREGRRWTGGWLQGGNLGFRGRSLSHGAPVAIS